MNAQTVECPGELSTAQPGLRAQPNQEGSPMSTNPNPSNRQSPSTHPRWCDPRECQNTASDRQHRGTPNALNLTDCTWGFEPVATDEHAFPGERGDTELLVTLTDGTIENQGGHTYLLLEEIPKVAAKLTELYWLIKHLSVPVRRVAA